MNHSGMTRITAVEPLRDFLVELTFTDGTVGEVDLEPLIWGLLFEPHRQDPDFFRQVTVDPVAGTIVWPNDTDLDPDVLHSLVTETYEELMNGEAASG